VLISRISCFPSATDEAARLRAAMRMQGEEDVAKFRHVLLRELAAERERLQRVLDSKVQSKRVFVVLACVEAALTLWTQLAAMKDVFAAEMLKREEAYAARIEQAVGTVRDVAVVHVQQETDVVKAVAASEMQQEIASAQEALSQEYAAKTGDRVRMVQELKAKLAALDHHLSVRVLHPEYSVFKIPRHRFAPTTAAAATPCTSSRWLRLACRPPFTRAAESAPMWRL
jgi:hypothetical protein